ncbi:Hypothetical predicted protein [Cloeon dipterum]|uniref:Zinc finger C2H2 LYAR-type domain-containing protein n=1 Tax=Cloeon dipterum TaxID=197152 RepID=A0A8S1C468_9INSE|nr:Hypothetical predicted protein [Cloeon dipterum]
MVYFICNNCGDSLKKNQVDQHFYKPRCKGCSVSCMDCHRDFDSKSYAQHNQCITEQEKYSGGNFTQKTATANKLAKRDEWCTLINDVANNRGPGRSKMVQDMLNFIAGLQTVPKKEKSFMNYANTLPRDFRNANAAQKVWSLLMEELSKRKEQNSNSAAPAKPAVEKSEKAKVLETVEAPVVDNTEKAGGETVVTHEVATPDVWKKAIKRLSKREGDSADVFKALAGLEDVPTGPKKSFKKYLRIKVPQAKNSAQIWSALNEEFAKINSKKRLLPEEVSTNGTSKAKKAKVDGNSESPKSVESEVQNGASPAKGSKFPWKKSVLSVLQSKYESLGLDTSDKEKMDAKLTQAIGHIANCTIMKKENKEVVMLVTGN